MLTLLMSDYEKESLDSSLLIDFVFSFKGFASLMSALSCLNRGLYSEFLLSGSQMPHVLFITEEM